MKQLTLNQFDLQKVKLTGKRGLKAFWYAMGNNNDLLSVDSDAIVHQDLLDFLEQFRVVFATSHEALDGWNHARDFIKGNDNFSISGMIEKKDVNRVDYCVMVIFPLKTILSLFCS